LQFAARASNKRATSSEVLVPRVAIIMILLNDVFGLVVFVEIRRVEGVLDRRRPWRRNLLAVEVCPTEGVKPGVFLDVERTAAKAPQALVGLACEQLHDQSPGWRHLSALETLRKFDLALEDLVQPVVGRQAGRRDRWSGASAQSARAASLAVQGRELTLQ